MNPSHRHVDSSHVLFRLIETRDSHIKHVTSGMIDIDPHPAQFMNSEIDTCLLPVHVVNTTRYGPKSRLHVSHPDDRDPAVDQILDVS